MTRGARAESDEDAMEVGVSEEILEKGAWRGAREGEGEREGAKGAARARRIAPTARRGASDD